MFLYRIISQVRVGKQENVSSMVIAIDDYCYT